MLRISKVNQETIRAKIQEGRIGGAALGRENFVDTIIKKMKGLGVIDELKHVVADKRAENAQIPMELLWTLEIDAKMNVKTSMTDIPYAIEDALDCEECGECPLWEGCTASKKNREMGVSKKLLAFREASHANIAGEEGIVPRVNRSIPVEGAFGVEKEDYHFRRFMTQGKGGVRCELLLLCFGCNVNKLHHKIQQGWCGTSLHRLKEKAS